MIYAQVSFNSKDMDNTIINETIKHCKFTSLPYSPLKIIFRTEINYTSFNNVVYLLEEIYKNGCLENYMQSIKELFDVSLDLGLLFEAWNETHNEKNALKLYKSRNASKRI